MRPRTVAPAAVLAHLMDAPPSLHKTLVPGAQAKHRLRANGKKTCFNYEQSEQERLAYWLKQTLVICDVILVMLPCGDEVVWHNAENTTEDLGLKCTFVNWLKY
jgi:hypothetical protein